ncbi:hypothetical protein [Mycobacterium simulans]|uniref:hypothetical protein n=1 Tax=Mycobacterium simulans TaxID=627089 RepID=UPI001CD27BE6|nr:hypothetical protein [Mycobacterium simulans]
MKRLTYKALQTSLDFANPYRPGANDPAIGGPAGLGERAQLIEVVVSLRLYRFPLVARRDEFCSHAVSDRPEPARSACGRR